MRIYFIHFFMIDFLCSLIYFDADGIFRENSLGPGEHEHREVGHVFVSGASLGLALWSNHCNTFFPSVTSLGLVTEGLLLKLIQG